MQLWGDVIFGATTTEGALTGYDISYYRCGKSSTCESYSFTVTDNHGASVTFTIDESGYDALSNGDHLRVTYARLGHMLYTVRINKDGNWVTVYDLSQPSLLPVGILTFLFLTLVLFIDAMYHHERFNFMFVHKQVHAQITSLSHKISA